MAGGLGTIANLVGKVNASNELVVSASVSTTGSAIEDGANAAIKATVLDLTSSNPLTVAITDSNGDQISSFGGGTQYNQGTASTDTDTGTAALVVRKDTPAAATGVADGDRTLLSVTSVGRLWASATIDAAIPAGNNNIGDVDVASSALPAGAATLAEQQTQTASLSVLDDWDETNRAAVNTIAGQVGVQGASGTVTALTQRVVLATDVALPAGNNNIGDVDVASSVLPTGASTLAEQQTQTASLSVMDDWDNAASDGASVSGDTAHDSADAGEPVKIGYKAISYGATPTAVTANDRTNAYANLAGIPFMLAGHPNVITTRTNYTAAQTNAAIITVAAGTKIVLLSCTVASDHACTVDVAVTIGFATATTPTGAGAYLSHPGIAPGSGIREAGMVAGADDEDLRITSEVPTTGSIDVVTKHFTIAS